MRASRTPRPPRVAYAEASCRPRLRGKKRSEVGLHIVCLAWLGTLAHMMRTRRLHARLCGRLGKALGARLGIAFGARPRPSTITYNAKASEQAARQRVLFCEKMYLDPRHQRMAEKNAQNGSQQRTRLWPDSSVASKLTS